MVEELVFVSGFLVYSVVAILPSCIQYVVSKKMTVGSKVSLSNLMGGGEVVEIIEDL